MKTTKMRKRWTLPAALGLVRALDAAVKPVGYALALTGSVLMRGASLKDVDLVVYPLSTAAQDRAALLAALASLGMRRVHDRDVVRSRWRRLGSRDEKHVEVWEYEGQRVDLFFLC